MKHGPRCQGCRVSMILEHETDGDYHVCPQCGHAEPVATVADDLTARHHTVYLGPVRDKSGNVVTPAEWFEKMRRAIE